MKINLEKKNTNRGFTVLIAIVVAGVTLAIALSILSITLKQLALGGIARESEIAFQAANAGAECVRFHDVAASQEDSFDVPGNGGEQTTRVSITCLGATVENSAPSADSDFLARSREEQRFAWTWDSNQLCADVSVYKYFSTTAAVDMAPLVTDRDCPEDVECTVVQARGYNAPCSAVTGSGSARIVERVLTYIY